MDLTSADEQMVHTIHKATHNHNELWHTDISVCLSIHPHNITPSKWASTLGRCLQSHPGT